MAGFECSTHVLRDGRRLDLVAATDHQRFAAADYARIREQGLLTAREGIRWHLIELSPYRYDWSSVLPILRAARANGVQVIWDIIHFGWPPDLDIFSPEFVRRYVALARAFAQLLVAEGEMVPFIAPVNEISFFAWAGASVAYINPFVGGRGDELKEQLVRCVIAGIEAIREVAPAARFVHPDPTINVVANPRRKGQQGAARSATQAMFEGWDMIAGRKALHLGGRPDYLDIIGINFYPHNQRLLDPPTTIRRGHPLFRNFRHILTEVHNRYHRPIIVSETGADGDERADWLRYMGREVRLAQLAGAAVEGVCLYPILNFPWWDDDQHLYNALWDYADEQGEREIYAPLAAELAEQQSLFAQPAVAV